MCNYKVFLPSFITFVQNLNNGFAQTITGKFGKPDAAKTLRFFPKKPGAPVVGIAKKRVTICAGMSSMTADSIAPAKKCTLRDGFGGSAARKMAMSAC